MNLVPAVLEQHAEEAAFLWILRNAAVRAPHYRVKDLAKLDSRLEAHLDGLRIAGPQGWEILRAVLALEDPGEVFAAAAVAFGSGDPERIDQVLEAASGDPELVRGIVSAIGWLPPKKADGRIQQLLASPVPERRRAGVAGAAIRRLVFESAMIDGVNDPDPRLKSRSLRALGELGLARHASLVVRHLGAVDPEVAWSAAWSAALLTGDPGAVAALQASGRGPGRRAVDSLVLAARRMPPAAAAVWRASLAAKPESVRAAILVAGAAGDPAAMPWILEQLANAAVARVAGEAFSTITGADLAYEDLEGSAPADFESGPNDDPEDENTEPDPDEHLPWPDTARVRARWESQKSSFAPGKRYLLGREIGAASAREALKSGRQRERAAAAIELAILEPGTAMVEVRSPALTGLISPAASPGPARRPP